MHADDASLIEQIGRIGETLTGFPFLSGYQEAWTGKKGDHLPGAFLDWLYEHNGIPAFTVETGLCYNYFGITTHQQFASQALREEECGLRMLAWHDEHPTYGLFNDWVPFDHPQLGPVELGGWHRALWSCAPLTEMEKVCKRCIRFVMEYATFVPQLAFRDVSVSTTDAYTYKLAVTLSNEGKVGTSITQQGAHTHPYAVLKVEIKEPVEYIMGRTEHDVGHLMPGEQKRLEWVIQTDRPSVTLVAMVRERGVQTETTVPLQASRKMQ